MTRPTSSLILRADAAANLAGGLALALLAGWLAPHAGLASPTPVRVLAAVLVVNGVANAAVARRPTSGRVAALVAVDAAFAGVTAALALLDPTGATPAVRWSLAALADLAAVVGAAKVWTGRASNVPATTS